MLSALGGMFIKTLAPTPRTAAEQSKSEQNKSSGSGTPPPQQNHQTPNVGRKNRNQVSTGAKRTLPQRANSTPSSSDDEDEDLLDEAEELKILSRRAKGSSTKQTTQRPSSATSSSTTTTQASSTTASSQKKKERNGGSGTSTSTSVSTSSAANGASGGPAKTVTPFSLAGSPPAATSASTPANVRRQTSSTVEQNDSSLAVLSNAFETVKKKKARSATAKLAVEGSHQAAQVSETTTPPPAPTAPPSTSSSASNSSAAATTRPAAPPVAVSSNAKGPKKIDSDVILDQGMRVDGQVVHVLDPGACIVVADCMTHGVLAQRKKFVKQHDRTHCNLEVGLQMSFILRKNPQEKKFAFRKEKSFIADHILITNSGAPADEADAISPPTIKVATEKVVVPPLPISHLQPSSSAGPLSAASEQRRLKSELAAGNIRVRGTVVFADENYCLLTSEQMHGKTLGPVKKLVGGGFPLPNGVAKFAEGQTAEFFLRKSRKPGNPDPERDYLADEIDIVGDGFGVTYTPSWRADEQVEELNEGEYTGGESTADQDDNNSSTPVLPTFAPPPSVPPPANPLVGTRETKTPQLPKVPSFDGGPRAPPEKSDFPALNPGTALVVGNTGGVWADIGSKETSTGPVSYPAVVEASSALGDVASQMRVTVNKRTTVLASVSAVTSNGCSLKIVDPPCSEPAFLPKTAYKGVLQEQDKNKFAVGNEIFVTLHCSVDSKKRKILAEGVPGNDEYLLAAHQVINDPTTTSGVPRTAGEEGTIHPDDHEIEMIPHYEPPPPPPGLLPEAEAVVPEAESEAATEEINANDEDFGPPPCIDGPPPGIDLDLSGVGKYGHSHMGGEVDLTKGADSEHDRTTTSTTSNTPASTRHGLAPNHPCPPAPTWTATAASSLPAYPPPPRGDFGADRSTSPPPRRPPPRMPSSPNKTTWHVAPPPRPQLPEAPPPESINPPPLLQSPEGVSYSPGENVAEYAKVGLNDVPPALDFIAPPDLSSENKLPSSVGAEVVSNKSHISKGSNNTIAKEEPSLSLPLTTKKVPEGEAGPCSADQGDLATPVSITCQFPATHALLHWFLSRQTKASTRVFSPQQLPPLITKKVQSASPTKAGSKKEKEAAAAAKATAARLADQLDVKVMQREFCPMRNYEAGPPKMKDDIASLLGRIADGAAPPTTEVKSTWSDCWSESVTFLKTDAAAAVNVLTTLWFLAERCGIEDALVPSDDVEAKVLDTLLTALTRLLQKQLSSPQAGLKSPHPKLERSGPSSCASSFCMVASGGEGLSGEDTSTRNSPCDTRTDPATTSGELTEVKNTRLDEIYAGLSSFLNNADSTDNYFTADTATSHFALPLAELEVIAARILAFVLGTKKRVQAIGKETVRKLLASGLQQGTRIHALVLARVLELAC
ncbi:unnamed protein product [Amoebophrya sp. A25]|nr:unnamed protein product [Amoebophrya sp. A25]|eukprot:GSA25T00010975001.1